MSDSEKKPEISWFGALCDDDYEFLGVVAPELRSSWEHCHDIVLCAEENGFDNILLPSGYELGIDATSFASAVSVATNRIRLLLAVRMGEMWLPQLARQMATIDQMSGGRLTINIISSDLPGQELESGPRYKRTQEYMKVLRELLNGNPIDFHGQFVDLEIEAPRVRTVSGQCPPFYFGGFSEAAKETAAMESDVFLTWPDTVKGVESIVSDMKERASGYGRKLKYGLRAHVIVRETEQEAREAANRLVSQVDDQQGAEIRNRSLDAVSVGVSRQTELRKNSDGDGFIEDNLWTGVGRARSGAGAAIVGDPDQVKKKINAYMDAGINAFILSGYPHISECELFGANVLNQIEHGPLT
ncbi:MAG: LLM class flavin-dependent oxidoreductase [Acidimicrobiales bacterium]|nr:LLM class flavin-dependent oxidoreductase [Acidimicrobiales bacterium]|tara:strand:+ start:1629 stop:2699 length:1071 start_codon:yes stop_codon:yes gene_type:complete